MINFLKNLSCKYIYLKVVNFIYNIFINYDLLKYQSILFLKKKKNINVYIYVIHLHICMICYLDSILIY